MENITSFTRQLKTIAKFPKTSEVNRAISSLSKKEWMIFAALGIICALSLLLILNKVNRSFMSEVPMRGGELSEGILGSPRFINPVLAFSDADRDMMALVYSGLMRKDPAGSLILDLAEKYEVSKDGLTYTFTLKDDLSFHDGKPLSVDDVIFTISKIKDPLIKSPKKVGFDGVTVEKIDDKNIKFVLRAPYASFLENMTIGIMPTELWKGSPLELNDLNTKPVGSGPYMISFISKQSSGVIDYYELESFKKFALGSPYIKSLTVRFYQSEQGLLSALRNKEVEAVGSIAPESAENLEKGNYRVESAILPRVFGLFFNQNQKQLFTNKTVVRAINDAIDKDRIIEEVLSGYGVAIEDPIPPNMIAYQKLQTENTLGREEITKRVESSLAKDGWKRGVSGYLEKSVTDKKKKKTTTILEFSISTGNAPELARSAELIKEDLSKVGIKVDVKTFEVGNLNQTVIRPRKYDALLFGQIITNESDLFAFWHSSQRKDPGLNVSMYTNAKVDKILEDAFVTLDDAARIKKYAQFEDEIKRDLPAVFLYSPNFIYIIKDNLKGLLMDHITAPSDRFSNIYSWYTETDNVWRSFVPD